MTTKKIPRIIHQVFFPIGEYPDSVWKVFSESREANLELHHDWSYRLWGPDNSRDFLVDHYPELLQFYLSLRYEIMRIDFIRYVVLYHFGGIYMDMDMIPLRSLDGLRNRQLLLHNIHHVDKDRAFIENDLMGSVPKLGFWKTIIAECQASVERCDQNPIYETWRGRYILQTTGPYMISRAVRKFYPKFKPSYLARTKWCPEELSFRPWVRDHKVGSWNNWEKASGAEKNVNAFATKSIKENKFKPEFYKPIINENDERQD